MNSMRPVLILALVVLAAWALGRCGDGGKGGEDAAEDTPVDPVEDTAAEADPDVPDDATAEEPADGDAEEDAPPPDVNGRLETVDGLGVLYLWGTREEIGYADGSLLCGKITKFFKEYVLDYVVPESGYDYATVTGLVRLMHVFPEGDLAEMEAMVQGMRDNCPPEDLIIESENLEPSAGGSREITIDDVKVGHALPDFLCSSLTAWGEASQSGKTIHARNLDFYIDPGGTFLVETVVKVYDSQEEGGARFLSVAVPGLIGCISCFTEDGGGITIHNAEGPSAGGGYVPRILTSRAALVASQYAADRVAAAEAVVEASPQYMGDNFHLSFPCDTADCIGGAVFELDGDALHEDGQVTVRLPGENDGGLETQDAIACTNHYQKRTVPEPDGSSSFVRFQAVVDGINASLAGGGLDAASALAIMAATAQQRSGFLTVHTTIMDTDTMQLHLHVATAVDDPSPNATPIVLSLPDLFAGFPE
jgi:hypothetical protein